MEKSCEDCKYFDSKELCCMYKCAIRAVLGTRETYLNCSDFKEGTYDQQELERTNYV